MVLNCHLTQKFKLEVKSLNNNIHHSLALTYKFDFTSTIFVT